MRVVTWNCNGAFRKKYSAVKNLNADIFIIQECENPETVNDEGYSKFASNYLWVGHKNKGLGVFAKDRINLKNCEWESYGLEWFISCTINDNLNLIGTWGCGNYIEDIYVYLKIHFKKMEAMKNLLICGDFNSNSCWDKNHKIRTHSAVVKDLESLNLHSCYHCKEDEFQGMESKPTFYLYKREDRSYHIDYCFYDKDKINDVSIGKYEDWISLSDHMPVNIGIDI
ncbi:hypothetical protein RBH29_11370 [Herbivorax sp. ANBcel31]|uniref:endonuclease/exonuclease/phosphatase family protein n=1 Tax=Herbivorax sp. ANBcel31 TaxID=3069754 RepID=UPI0027B22E77|nr:endonuclease/exonuclease/phosphatase family protein [Herbivorax sp. ANBcel31]MDQ2087027.1 hypothetical protein [Herbivorax sp. ANBcel31]